MMHQHEISLSDANTGNGDNAVHTIMTALNDVQKRLFTVESANTKLKQEKHNLLQIKGQLMGEVQLLQDGITRLQESNASLSQELHIRRGECSKLREHVSLLFQENCQLKESSLIQSQKSDHQHDHHYSRGVSNSHQPGDRLNPGSSSAGQHQVFETSSQLSNLETKSDNKSENLEEITKKLMALLVKEKAELEEKYTQMEQIQKNSSCISSQLSVGDLQVLGLDKDVNASVQHALLNTTQTRQALAAERETLVKLLEDAKSLSSVKKFVSIIREMRRSSSTTPMGSPLTRTAIDPRNKLPHAIRNNNEDSRPNRRLEEWEAPECSNSFSSLERKINAPLLNDEHLVWSNSNLRQVPKTDQFNHFSPKKTGNYLDFRPIELLQHPPQTESKPSRVDQPMYHRETPVQNCDTAAREDFREPDVEFVDEEKVCPVCQIHFPRSMVFEEFERHVFDHFETEEFEVIE